ncbi:MAG: acetyl-CoA carboxylase biotin carboxyl carrier protein [Aquificota bacterium]|nr:MAG: acetyl-CoA carboxylase biotin carboxyl carrier protein [Aquificota bacterium]
MDNILKILDELVKRIEGKKIEEIKIETGDTKITIKQYVGPKEVISQPTQQVEIKEVTSSSPKTDFEQKKETNYHVIKSPLVGTFYRAPSPGAPPFVEEGDIVSKGQVLCIIEALKVMNEIESDINGKIVKILVENGQPVDYGQELFYIEQT